MLDPLHLKPHTDDDKGIICTMALPTPYDLWRSELASPTPEERRIDLPFDPHLMWGFWRALGARTKFDQAISIWGKDDDEKVYFRFGDRPALNTVDNEREWHQFSGMTWLNCVACTEADYRTAVATGYWPSAEGETIGKAARHFTEAQKLDIIPDGGNNPPPITEQLAEKLKAAIRQAEKVLVVNTPAEAQQAAEALKVIRDLGAYGEKHRVSEKSIYDNQAKAVQTKWMAVLRPGLDAANVLVAKISQYQKKQQAVTGDKPRVAAEFGRAIVTKTVKVGVITDPDAFTAAIIKTRAFTEWCQEQANTYAKAGIVLDGMKIETE